MLGNLKFRQGKSVGRPENKNSGFIFLCYIILEYILLITLLMNY